MHGKIKTYEYLYLLNLGPPDPCVVCGLVLETSDHLFRHCHISARIWRTVEFLANIKTNLVCLIASGEWLNFHAHGNSKFLPSIIETILWQIWISRCNRVFWYEIPEIFKIANLVVLHVKEFSICYVNHKMQNYLMQNRPNPGNMVFSLQLLGMEQHVKEGWVLY